MPEAPPFQPAWSEAFVVDRRPALQHPSPFGTYDRELAWGGATGAGVTVAIIDSGVDPSHPAVGRVRTSVLLERDGDSFDIVSDPDCVDLVGHGTACAGIIRSIAPDVELVSVRVLGADNKTSGVAFAYALDWVITQGIQVVNLSLSSRSEELHGTFHELVDRAYFANCLLVCSASNTQGQASYPSLFSSVVSVASHDVPDPWTYYYNPKPPVEFGAWGVNVPVAWQGGARLVASGNSFAAPHITGLAAL
ncbi:MAG TPA: S8 family serine peptidase, partial [Gemmatimonadaceae bacterium]|nr:S8 family serine peptidase [Gemmatimonadaceae bacterium]